jgi:hypothetical protein
LVHYSSPSNMPFFQKWRIESKTGPVWVLVPVRRERIKERVCEGECGGNISTHV